MESEKNGKGKKRSRSYYKKCAYGGKKQRMAANILEPGIRGFLVMCNHNEKSAVRESYNILNDYADIMYSIEKPTSTSDGHDQKSSEEGSDEDDDIEEAMKREVEGMKSITPSEKRFQNVLTKAKNCVFIRTNLESPVDLVTFFMEDIAHKKVQRARYAARILPIVGTCKAVTSDIEKLASEVLSSVFLPSGKAAPKSYTIIFKSRNNNGSCCGREGVVSSLIKIIKDINSDVKFTWSDYSVAVLVEIVCTVCCIGVAPDYIRLRKYNLQELTKGAVTGTNVISEGEAQDRDSGNGDVLKSEPDTCRGEVTCAEEEIKKRGEVEEEKEDVTEKSRTVTESDSDNRPSVEQKCDVYNDKEKIINDAQIEVDSNTDEK